MTEQTLLPTFAPSEQDMVDMALAQPLERKIERAIMLLKHWEPAALKLDPRGYWVADSFGKDSDCIVELAKMAGVAHHCEHNLTTLDPPELIHYGKRVRPETHINKPSEPLLHRMLSKTCGPPTRKIRWCCEEYKERGGGGVAKIIGIRIEESGARAKMWSEFVHHTQNNARNNGFVLCPIAYWTTKDVWEFHGVRKLPHCCLYDEGFTRLGCVGCPKASAKNQAMEFSRWPKIETAWRRAFDKFWEAMGDRKRRDGTDYDWRRYGNANGHYQWWRSGVGQGDGPACQGAELFATHELGEENANDE